MQLPIINPLSVTLEDPLTLSTSPMTPSPCLTVGTPPHTGVMFLPVSACPISARLQESHYAISKST